MDSRRLSSSSEDTFNDGLILPNLIVQLRKILDQYPDDTQILKELIQNAEDAGARHVKFLYDRNSYGKNPKRLQHQGISRFQGPALYAFNDSHFTEDDWKGIRMLSQSVKENDPMKVGYFGMGFKSVFHMTDVPMILSGHRLGLIDPHRSLFAASASTFAWHLGRSGADLLSTFPDQVAPFMGVFGASDATFADGYYANTLFRFPLRDTPSELSSVIYDEDKMTRLYRAFEKDAHLVLVFLNHLESVELYERAAGKREPRLAFAVKISDDCIDEVRAKRSAFLTQLKASATRHQAVVNSYALTVETVSYGGGGGEEEAVRACHRWYVTSYCCGDQVSTVFRRLRNDPDLHYVAWVGTAMPLRPPRLEAVRPDDEGADGRRTDEEEDDDDDDGHVFCFLPLPADAQASTGLPVHVNGFFALEQNRKHIKWPSASQGRGRPLDKRLRWNECLLSEALPQAYASMLLSAIERVGSDPLFTPAVVYRAFPDAARVGRQWQALLPSLYTELFRYPVIYTRAGQWRRAEDAHFNALEEREAEPACAAILEVLGRGCVRVAAVPPHVFAAVRRHCRTTVPRITPAVVSAAYRSMQYNASLPAAEKLDVLRYLLKQLKYELLDGLEMLPLASGAFHTIHVDPRHAERPIYIGSEQHPQALLPGLEDELLDDRIDDDLRDMLRRTAQRGYTQLRVLDTPLVAQLLPRCLPAEWQHRSPVLWDPSQCSHPPADWLATVWRYLLAQSSMALTDFEQLPLVPLTVCDGSEEGTRQLARLGGSSPLVARQLEGLCLAEGLAAALTRIGMTVIDQLDPVVRAHPLVTRHYIYTPTHIGVLRALAALAGQEAVGGPTGLGARIAELTTDDDKRCLREMIAKISSREMTREHGELLAALPLFETWDGGGSAAGGAGGGKRGWVSAGELQLALPDDLPPVHLSRPLIDVSSPSAASLGACLGVRRLSTVELLTGYVFPAVEAAHYERADVERLMVYVLRHYHTLADADAQFAGTLRALPFLARGDLLLTADRFYDPAHELLQAVFWGENSFPPGVFGEPANLAVLREAAGMRGPDDVDPDDLLEASYQVEEMSTNDDVEPDRVADKSDALLRYLKRYPAVLQADCQGRPLHACLSEVRWMRRLLTKPAGYPASLAWYGGCGSGGGGGQYERPAAVYLATAAAVVGSVAPVVAGSVCDEVRDAFSLGRAPDPRLVVEHFANAVRAYNGAEKASFIQIASDVYAQMALWPTADTLALLDACRLRDCWIWHGEGFAGAAQVLLSEPFADLRPLVFSLPTEMLAAAEFFRRYGVRQTCHLPGVLLMIGAKYAEPAAAARSEADVKRDLHICVSVLNEIRSTATAEDLPALQDELLLPTYRKTDDTICMAPLAQCTYCDQEWLRQGYDLGDLDEEEEERILLVHTDLPNRTAAQLGVPTLMSRMLDAEELDFSFGQSDSLPHRLGALLQDYTDGFAVPKELVQNADDAGATIVRILYDERMNNDARTCLIDEGMKECQGPALWAYNDAVFSDADFENITKLNGATKESRPDTIGRFGVGFNAVYNLTDVPSFVSRHSVVIFDPQTTHLGKSIRNKARPGIRIDLRRHRRKLRRLANQFRPYNDVFGCNLRPDGGCDNYDGTLFRFPLRTRAQAARSEISQKVYNQAEVKALLRLLIVNAESLLLFTQNVIQLAVYHLPANATNAAHPVQIFSVTKSPLRILRELQPLPELSEAGQKLPARLQQFVRNCRVLKSSATAMTDVKSRGASDVMSVETPSSAVLLLIDCALTTDGEKLLSMGHSHTSRPWLVCSHMGRGESLRMALQEEHLLPLAAVAAPLVESLESNTFAPVPIGSRHAANEGKNAPSKPGGTFFTYLPLPVRSGLPVHVNGSFAVTTSRRYLCERNVDDKFDVRAVWNEALLCDAVSSAYISLLEHMTELAEHRRYEIDQLLPQSRLIESICQPLAESLFRRLASSEPNAPRLFYNGHQYVSASDALFLEPDLQQSTICQQAIAVINECLSADGKSVVKLSEPTRASFKAAHVDNMIADRSYSKIRFFENVFLPNILDVSVDNRNDLVLYALRHSTGELCPLLADSACIPVTPNGEVLKQPRELVDPTSEIAKLYSPSDGKFPFKGYADGKIIKILRGLGMTTNSTTWDALLERAEALSGIENAFDMQLSKVLLLLCEKKLEESSTAQSAADEPSADIVDRFSEASMLPIKKRPPQFLLQWNGSDYEANTLLPAKYMYAVDRESLVCCVSPIVDETVFPRKDCRVKALLGLNEKRPQLDEVLEQLSVIAVPSIESLLHDKQSFTDLQRLFMTTYSFLQKLCNDDDDARLKISEFLAGRNFLLCHSRLLSAERVAFTFTQTCAPYLYVLPEHLRRGFPDMLRAAGVKEKFGTLDFVHALQEMHESTGVNRLERQSLKVALQLVSLLNDSMTELDQSLSDVVDVQGCDIYIPDASCVLRLSSELCFSEPDCQWVPAGESVNFSHPLIPFAISQQLGVNTRRQEMLRQHSRGIAFGQRERLTARLRRIMTAYPCDKEILKELLQNADDAGCSQIHFIKDARRHSTKRIFAESWAPLQGPALCVYNDKPFSDSDLSGIQQLGAGSKATDPNRTGQYGVGFNCVYHLTDVPSFLTASPAIGETLCIFDPHARYVPGASAEEPGRRFENVAMLREIFTDIFPCYLEDKYPSKNSTMFRFPLRDATMCADSELSDAPFTTDMLDALLAKFRPEIFDCLLFMNNVRSVTITEVDKRTNKLVNTYTVRAEISTADGRMLKDFSDFVKKIASQLTSGELQITDVPMKDVTYTVTVSDGKSVWEKWLISQRVGFQPGTQLPNSVCDAFKKRELALLPRGGVAALIDSSNPAQMPLRSHKAFCFLPLPVKLDLPVHVNAHFALDHESRRNLWYDDDETSVKTLWNQALITHVIAPAYTTLLRRSIAHLSCSVLSDHSSLMTSLNDDIPSAEIYAGLFPRYTSSDPYWCSLVTAVYQCIHANQELVLPVIKPTARLLSRKMTSKSLDTSLSSQTEIEWMSTGGTAASRPYFDDLDSTFPDEDEEGDLYGSLMSLRHARRRLTSTPKQSPVAPQTRAACLRRVLLTSGFKLVRLPLDVCEAFKRAGIEVDSVSPLCVSAFYADHKDGPCRIGSQLPTALCNTPFKSDKWLRYLLDYCLLERQSFLSNLNNMPLLLCHDDQLYVFNAVEPVYLTAHQDVLPSRGSLFVHNSVAETTFADIDIEMHDVFRRFDVAAFADLISKVLPAGSYRSDKAAHVSWSPPPDDALDDRPCPNPNWLRRVFRFLREEYERMFALEEDEVDEQKLAKSVLHPLRQWSVLPAHVCYVDPAADTSYYGRMDLTEHYLVPLGLACTVIDFKHSSSVNRAVKQALCKVGVPELNCTLLDGANFCMSPLVKSSKTSGGTMSRNSNSAFARLLVATLDRPEQVLQALHYAMNKISSAPDLAVADCHAILRYFNDTVDAWSVDNGNVELLRSLPLFHTAGGQIVPLGSGEAFVFSGELPAIDMDMWQSQSGVVFLRRNVSLEALYEVLGCRNLTSSAVYTQFIFRNFQYLSAVGRARHLEYIRDTQLPSLRGVEREQLLASLRELLFLSDSSSGVLRRACDFHDPYHPVFKAMLAGSSAAFAPCPYNAFAWREFMCAIGLRQEVSGEALIAFAEEVAREAHQRASEDTFNKARVLVTYLFRRHDVTTEGILERLSDINFIPCSKVKTLLSRIHCSLGRDAGADDTGFDSDIYVSFRTSIPETYEYVTWTSAFLLPDWANPFRLSEAEVSYSGTSEAGSDVGSACSGVGLERYREEIGHQLGVQAIPSVEQVVWHVHNVCGSVGSVPATHRGQAEDFGAFMKVDVMKHVYRFLQTHCMEDAGAREQLADAKCIVVDSGHTFVQASQVVITLYEQDQITPYLYKMPTELGEFKQLLLYLGATLNASADQYAMVLSSMYQQTDGEKLHPNEMRAAFKAVYEMFTALQRQHSEPITAEQMYLPSAAGLLVLSTDLVFNNDPTYTDRIRNFDRPFLVDLVECGITAINYEDVVQLLPNFLRPAMLTGVVKEKLEIRSRETIVSFGIAEKLRHQLNSRAFSSAIVRLIRHEGHRSGQRTKQGTLDTILEQLKKIRVFGVESLKTYLCYEGRRVESSELESECFVERSYEATEGEEIWNIYIDSNITSLNEELLVSVAEVVNRIVGGLLRNSVHYLQPVLSSAPHAICRVLDRLKIRPDHSIDFHQPTLPTTGSFVPIEDHHLLKEDFEVFEPGEYVGLELDDNDDSDNGPTIVYATIMEAVSAAPTDRGKIFLQKYKINVGDDHKPIVVYITDLYKFHRVEGLVSRNASVADGDATLNTSQGETMYETWEETVRIDSRNGTEEYAPDSLFGTAQASAEEGSQNVNVNGVNDAEEDNIYTRFRHAQQPPSADAAPSVKTVKTMVLSASQNGNSVKARPRAEGDANGAPDATDGNAAPANKNGEGGEKEGEEAGSEFCASERTVEELMNELSDKLEEAWRLPAPQRKKIIKRLLLKWHPDKNIDNEELATIIMQHLHSEVDRLAQGIQRPEKFENFDFDLNPANPFSNSESFKRNYYNAFQYFYEQINQRAKEHREQRERYRENFSREYADGMKPGDFDVPPSFSSSNPQPAQAKRFLRQAQEDLRASDNDYDAREPAYEWACFKAHQAAEKALKAAQFAVDAVSSFSHDLTSIAATLEDPELRRLAFKLQSLIGDSNKLYNPDPIDFVVIPHDEYTMEMACDVVMCATDILERVKEFVEIRTD